MKRLISVALLATLVLAGCGDGDDRADARDQPWGASSGEDETFHDDAPAAPTGGPGIYTIAPPDGGIITLDLTGELVTDELVTRAEALRDAVGYEPGQWVRVTVDNTKGTESIYLDYYPPDVVTGSGAMVKLNNPMSTIGSWALEVGDPSLTDDLYYSWDAAVEGEILPGAKYEGYLLADKPIDGVSRVFMGELEGYIGD